MCKIGVFGSAFGPPTLGHYDLIQQSLNEFDEIWLVPSYSHGFGKIMFPYEFRCKLTKAFAADLNSSLNKPSVFVRDVEHLIENDKPAVFTYDLLSYLEKTYSSGNKYTFIMGPDNEKNWSSFYKSSEIKKKWGVYVGIESKKIRSTLVRELIAEKKPIENLVTPGVKTLMEDPPREVLDLIREQAAKKKREL